jgi:uncharacterized protein (DUF952 family)
MSEHDRVAYKVLTAEQMAEFAQVPEFVGSSVDLADGYVHLSSAAQVDETVAKHFAGQDGLTILAVDLAALGDAIKWQASRGGALFPHIYGSLPWSAVLAEAPLRRGPGGRIILPEQA